MKTLCNIHLIKFSKILMPEQKDISSFIPERASEKVFSFVRPYNVLIEVKSMRSSLGKFQYGSNGGPHKIRIKQGISKELFLLVLLHEIAHLKAYIENGRAIKPHGKEWKNIFSDLLKEVIPLGVFPEKVMLGINEFMKNPGASMVNSKMFYNCFDDFSSYVPIREMSVYDYFVLKERYYYQILKTERDYILCYDLQNMRKVRLRKSAHVSSVSADDIPSHLK